MSKRDPEHALRSRVGAGCVVLFLGVQMTVVVSAGHALAGIPILAALCAPFALFAICGFARLSFEGGGVRIVNACRAHLIPWDDIERFSLGAHGLLRRVGVAELRDGRRVGIWGIQGPNAMTRRSTTSAERLIAAMNAELGRRRPAVQPELSERVPSSAPARPPRRKLVGVPFAAAPGRRSQRAA